MKFMKFMKTETVQQLPSGYYVVGFRGAETPFWVSYTDGQRWLDPEGNLEFPTHVLPAKLNLEGVAFDRCEDSI